MATPEELNNHLLAQQIQQLQVQFAAAMVQSQQEREAMRGDMQALAAENKSLREQAQTTHVLLAARSSASASENFSKQIKVEDFYGESGDKYRNFKMHLTLKFKRELYSDEEKLDFLSSRCQDSAGTFISRFTDRRHPNFEPLEYDEVLERMDGRYYGSESKLQNDAKVDKLVARPLSDAKKYHRYLEKFERLQDHCSYSQAVLKQRFQRGLPEAIAVTLLARLNHPETLVEFQSHVSSLMDAYVGMTSYSGGNGQARPSHKDAMDVDQVGIQSLLQRPFDRKLSLEDRELLSGEKRWFCCRQKGFSPQNVKAHQAGCRDYKEWKSSSRGKTVAAVSSETSDGDSSDRYSLQNRNSSSLLTPSGVPAPIVKEGLKFEGVVEECSREQGIKKEVPNYSIHEAVNGALSKLTFEVKMGQDDSKGKFLVLVDSGAQVNVVRRDLVYSQGWRVHRGSAVKLRMANGSQVVVRERVTVDLQKGSYSIKCQFLVADIVQDAILGLPWMDRARITGLDPSKGQLDFREGGHSHTWWSVRKEDRDGSLGSELVDLAELEDFCQGDPETEMYVLCGESEEQSTHLTEHTKAEDPRIQALLEKYQDVFQEPSAPPPARPEDHQIELELGKQPPSRGIGRLDEVKLQVLKETLEDLLKKGYIQPSTSPFGANVLFARKPDGTFRLCVDYRGLNSITTKNATPLPHLGELRDRLGAGKWYSKMDLRDGFYNLLMAAEDRHKTAFRTRYGHYEWVVMPMGLCNSPASFQSMMNRIFGHLYDSSVVAYLDDIVAYDESEEQHLRTLEGILALCRTNRLYLKRSKCSFLQEEVVFCGLKVGQGRVSPDPDKTASLKKVPLNNLRELQGFLGLLNWFKDFLPDFARRVLPLTRLLKKEQPWSWGSEEQTALESLVDSIQKNPKLGFFDPKKRVEVYTDASDFAVGGWIGQPEEDGRLCPVVFWSRKLKKAELNYSVTEKELLAIVALAEAHRPYFTAQEVVLRTDHRPLIWLQSQPVLSGRQARWITRLQELPLKIEYIPGRYNQVADFLSRQPAVSPKCSVCTKKIVEYDPEQGGSLQELSAEHLELNVLDLTGDLARQSQALKESHDDARAGHPGQVRTLEKIRRFYLWPTMKDDVVNYVKTCDSCQRTKPQNIKPLGLLKSLPIPEARFSCIGLDWFSLPTDREGFDMVMIVVDYLTKFTSLIPYKSSFSSERAAELFREQWVEKGFGLPSVIVSDRDSKLTGKFWKKLCSQLGISLQLATARHQQTNGQVERTIRTTKTTLLSLIGYDSTDWRRVLSAAAFALNDSVSSSTGQTPFYLTLGQHPQSQGTVGEGHPWSQMEGQVRQSIQKAHEAQAKQYNKNRSAHTIQPGDKVLLDREGINWAAEVTRSPRLLSPWLGPFRVLEVTEQNVTLELPSTTKIHNIFSVSKIKPYHSRPGSELPLPDFLDGAPEYEVERILDQRTWKRHRQYLVKWRGMGHERNQWLFADDMVNCQELINEYLSTGGGVTAGSRSGVSEPVIRLRVKGPTRS